MSIHYRFFLLWCAITQILFGFKVHGILIGKDKDDDEGVLAVTFSIDKAYLERVKQISL